MPHEKGIQDFESVGTDDSNDHKSLSPVLSSNITNRKALCERKRNIKSNKPKSQIKLCEKFQEKHKKDLIGIPFTKDSFSLSNTDNSVQILHELETIEQNRQSVYKMLTNTQSNDSCFKKPLFTIPSNCEITSEFKKENNSLETMLPSKSVSLEQFQGSQQESDQTCDGFKTATGKNVTLPEVSLKQHAKIFDDILTTSSQGGCDNWKNKFTILSRKRKGLLLEGTTKTSDKVSQSFNFKQTIFNSNVNQLEEKDDFLSMTQEISRSGISDAQIINALDDILEQIKTEEQTFSQKSVSENSEFLGFTLAEIKDSESKYSKINITLDKSKTEHLFLLASASGLSPPSKRIKFTIENKCAEVSSKQSFQTANKTNGNMLGFSTAAGNLLSISAASIEKTKDIFDDLESKFPLSKQKIGHSFEKKYSSFGVEKNSIANSRMTTKDKMKLFDQMIENKNFNFLDLPTENKDISKSKNIIRSSEYANKTENCGLLEKKNVSKCLAREFSNSSKPNQASNINKFNNLCVNSNHTSGLVNSNFSFPNADAKDISITDSRTANKKKLEFFDQFLDKFDECSTNNELNSLNALQDSVKLSNANVRHGNVQIPLGLSSKAKALSERKENNSYLNANNSSNSFSNFKTAGFSSAAGNSIQISEDAAKKANDIFSSIDGIENLEMIKYNVRHGNVQTPLGLSRKGKALSERKENNSYLNANNSSNSFSNSKTAGFSSAAGNSIQISEDAAKKANDIFSSIDGIENLEMSKHNVTKKSQYEIKDILCSTPTRSDISNLNTNRKRKLGMSSCKQISISGDKLKKARVVFDENFVDISPIKPLPNLRTEHYSNFSTPVKNNAGGPSIITFNKLATVTSTPLQKEVLKSINCVDQNAQNQALFSQLSIVVDSPTKGNCTKWIQDLETERQKIEEQLKILIEREKTLRKVLSDESNVSRKPRSGILYLKKKAKSRVSLLNFVQNKKPGDDGVNDKLNFIVPQNAENLHFKEYSASVSCEEKTLVTPNIKDLIGLTEIEYAFRNMSGVEPSLLLKDWVRNHFKWINWKLASYERTFPKYFDGSLTVENIMQQLKYRYDREIDKAERSALRRIYEKDDAPQKRMVLCVSDIKEISTKKYELELTDGWYRIRTNIDEPLCHQVLNDRIKIGTKIITYGAELLNCDGCHPLETTDLTCLKINYNSTRRAAWYAKLGYQKFAEPFPIPIRSIHPFGGLIGAVKILIIRSYPFNYMERCEGKTIWRNKKAEERRAQIWDNEKSRKIEKIQEDVMRKSSYSEKRAIRISRRNIKDIDISTISCPKELFEIIETCSDPDSVEQNLTHSQKSSLLEYKRMMLMTTQDEVTSKIKEEIERLKMTRRDVKSTLKLLVTDIKDNTNRPFNFVVWQSNESHIQMLREGASFAVYNILPQKNGDLCTGNKTVFKLLSQKNQISDSLKRKIIQIEDLTEITFTYGFCDFDTIGIIVNTKIEDNFQEIWLTNVSGSLLYVRVFEGPTTCLLLEGMKRGQIISVCNLLFKGSWNNVAHATANHFTIFSCYSQYQHLQEGLEALRKELPKNLNQILDGCDNKIAIYKMKSFDSKINSSTILDESDEETTLHTSRLTSTDVALSLLDLDQFK